jgi:hypothetical protein
LNASAQESLKSQGLGQIRAGIRLKRIFFFLANESRFVILS